MSDADAAVDEDAAVDDLDDDLDDDDLDDEDESLDAVDEVEPVPTTAAAGADQFSEDSGDEVDGNQLEGGVSRAVLEYLARSIVDEPDAVFVDVEQGRGGVTLRLHVSPGDMGRVIGRRGRVAQAIRTVVRAAGASEGVNAEVDIVD